MVPEGAKKRGAGSRSEQKARKDLPVPFCPAPARARAGTENRVSDSAHDRGVSVNLSCVHATRLLRVRDASRVSPFRFLFGAEYDRPQSFTLLPRGHQASIQAPLGLSLSFVV